MSARVSLARRALVGLSALLVLAAAASCGSDDGAPSAETTEPPTTGASTTTEGQESTTAPPTTAPPPPATAAIDEGRGAHAEEAEGVPVRVQPLFGREQHAARSCLEAQRIAPQSVVASELDQVIGVGAEGCRSACGREEGGVLALVPVIASLGGREPVAQTGGLPAT